MDTFFVTDVDRTPLAVAYMGTLRKDSEQVFNSIQKRLQATEGKAHPSKAGPETLAGVSVSKEGIR